MRYTAVHLCTAEKEIIVMKSNELKKVRMAAMLLLAGLLAFSIIGCGESPEDQDPNESDLVTYEVIGNRNTSNSGQENVTLVLVDRKFVNTEDMESLGQLLVDDFKSTDPAFIYVYTDESAASAREMVMAEIAPDSTVTFHDNNLVGMYIKNKAFGMHEFQVYIDGFKGSPSVTKY